MPSVLQSEIPNNCSKNHYVASSASPEHILNGSLATSIKRGQGLIVKTLRAQCSVGHSEFMVDKNTQTGDHRRGSPLKICHRKPQKMWANASLVIGVYTLTS